MQTGLYFENRQTYKTFIPGVFMVIIAIMLLFIALKIILGVFYRDNVAIKKDYLPYDEFSIDHYSPKLTLGRFLSEVNMTFRVSAMSYAVF